MGTGVHAYVADRLLDVGVIQALAEASGAADLAPADRFHTRGKPATIELARLAGLRGGERVLDGGGGVGGPARGPAAEFGCTVAVPDLTEAYCRPGERLTELTGLSDRVTASKAGSRYLRFRDRHAVRRRSAVLDLRLPGSGDRLTARRGLNGPARLPASPAPRGRRPAPRD